MSTSKNAEAVLLQIKARLAQLYKDDRDAGEGDPGAYYYRFPREVGELLDQYFAKPPKKAAAKKSAAKKSAGKKAKKV